MPRHLIYHTGPNITFLAALNIVSICCRQRKIQRAMTRALSVTFPSTECHRPILLGPSGLITPMSRADFEPPLSKTSSPASHFKKALFAIGLLPFRRRRCTEVSAHCGVRADWGKNSCSGARIFEACNVSAHGFISELPPRFDDCFPLSIDGGSLPRAISRAACK